MAESQAVWGIDVGKRALKAIRLRQAADKSIELLDADYIEHSKIMSQQDVDKDALWAASLQKFLSRHDISRDKTAVAVPGQLTLARFSKLPPVEKKKIPDIVRYEADQQIPFDIDEVVWDYQEFQTPDSPDIEVGIFAIKRDLIRDHLLHFEAAQIEPMLVQSGPLALYNALVYDGLVGDATTILVDIGTENTDLLVATQNSLWTRTIPVGGNAFTDALVKSFKLSYGKAETLKRTAAQSKYARQVFQAMRPVFSDLVQELQRSIGFYTATHRDAELGKVIGLGSAFKLPGLVKYLHQNLQLDVEYLSRFQKIAIPKSGQTSPDLAPNFAISYGLAVQGLGQARVISSLLPPEIAKQAVWRSKRPFFAAAAACLLLSAGVIWFRQVTDTGTLADNLGNPPTSMSLDQAKQFIDNPSTGDRPREFGKKAYLAAQTYKREQGKLSGQGDEELRKIESIQKLLEERAIWPRILSVIHDALPAPPGRLADADTADAYLDVLKSGDSSLQRDKRKELFIDRFDAKFMPKVATAEIEDVWTKRIKDPVESPTGAERPGFVITLHCSTPYGQNDDFVNKVVLADFFPNLRRTGRQPKQGFYINRIAITRAATDDGSSGSSGRGRDRSRGRSDRSERGGSGSPASKLLDPLTGEDMSGDYQFVVTLDVVLEDLPEKPNPENEQNNA